jgi:aminoglycoside phosphotransferase (APT) family kinase protein
LPAPDEALTQAAAVARALVGGAVELERVVGGGRNSRIWRVVSGARVFALKQYPPRGHDPRDRLSTEVDALRLMEFHDLDTVPRVVGVDDQRGYALLTWIDGRDVVQIGNGDIDAAVEFLGAIHDLRTVSGSAKQPLAAEACLSGQEIVRQVEERLTRLRSAPARENELIEFLEHSFAPQFAHWSTSARNLALEAGLDFDGELPQEWRSLVPSDFGFHNSLRRSDGSLAFVDFEYFGWDDPVKMTADILLHPGRTLPPIQRDRFRQAATRLYGGDDRAFARRLSAYLPLFGCRWVLIMLNEFIPELWRRRILAGDSGSWSEAKARQLGKARDFLAALPQKFTE